MSKEIEFHCPNCNAGDIEEIQAEITVASDVNSLVLHDDGVDIDYGEQTNEGGHVVRYQCKNCGYNIVDDNSEHADDGLDEHALVKAIQALNAKEPKGRGELVGFPILLNKIKNAQDRVGGKELAEIFNSLFPDQQVKYIGDSMFEAMSK